MKGIRQVTLDEYIKQNGYTREEWDKTVGELCQKGQRSIQFLSLSY